MHKGNVCKNFHLFDSFCGLPRLEGTDQVFEQFGEGDFAFSKEKVINFLKSHDILVDDSIEFHEGWIEDSFKD